ncbi:MAG: hypothetical protein GY934_22025 [Gammaproteobacteria bacterium]|nr:hypothetical protein [Gammaproteobacteria bacterium]
MKKLMSVLMIVMAVTLMGCAGPYAVSGLGSSEGDAGVSIGKVVNENIEVGVTAISYNIEDNHDTYGVGPYAAYLITDPLPTELTQDWQPFTGGSLLCNFDDGQGEFIPQLFGGVIYKPHDYLSPVYVMEKQFPSGAINSPDISERGEDLYHWFGLRYRF